VLLIRSQPFLRRGEGIGGGGNAVPGQVKDSSINL
jgi:hypothetical protein